MRSAKTLLPGTLDLLILQTLAAGSQHGYGIACHLKTVSGDVLQVGESSLYPALQRFLLNGWVEAAWGTSENNRRARFYCLTAGGRHQLTQKRDEFDRIIFAIQRVLDAAREAVVLLLETCCGRGTLHEALDDVDFVRLSPDDAVRNALDKPVEVNGRSYDFVEVNRVQYLREVDYMHDADDSLNGGASASEFSYQVLPATA